MRIGIDLGGTKIEVIALDTAGNERFRARAPTPQGDYAATLRAITGLVGSAESAIGKRVQGIGVGTPGAISPVTGLIKNSNSTCLIGMPLDKDLEKTIGRPVRLANDANCFALSEATDGAGQGCEVVFGVIIGTGTGAGIVVRGQVLTGPNAIAGEWGHNPLPWPRSDELPGRKCYCGMQGCIETFLSGPGLERDHHAKTGETVPGVEIARRADNGDAIALETIRRYEDRMARALVSIVNVLDPDVIVLGGGVSNIDRLYREVPAIWEKYAFSDKLSTRLVRARFGDSSGVRGAAWLWPETP